MNNALPQPVWAGFEFRLEPGLFPQTVSWTGREERRDVTATVDHRGAVLRKVLTKSGLPVSMALPVRAFKGIAARAIDHGNGTVTVTLELHHTDPQLSIPLLVAHDLNDIAADWRAWAAVYSLPMLMVEADGVARPLEDDMEARAAAPRRRRRNAVRERRPRFLMRRRTGSLGVRMRIEGREIIARR